MSAGRYDMVVEQNTTINIPINYKADSVNVDLSGYSAKLEVRENYDLPPLVTFTSDLTSNGFIFMNGAAGTSSCASEGNLQIYMTSANSKHLFVGTASYDLLLVAPNNEVDRFLEGSFTVKRGITDL